jgi:hypothetical protein
MDLSRLQESGLFGRFYLKVRGNRQFDTYFQTIDVLRPLLNSGEWNEAVTGYYINVAGNMDTVRLSYFTSNPSRTASCIDSFCTSNNIQSQNPEIPHATRISEGYGGEELRFRRYLYTYTLIGLDIMSADLLYARRLMATFRLQVMLSRQSYTPHFQRTFEEQSPGYNSLSAEQKEQFWSDLSNWPDLRQVDWAHMMVNMILPGDFVNNWNYFLTPRSALNLDEINRIIQGLGFRIPRNWHPLV